AAVGAQQGSDTVAGLRAALTAAAGLGAGQLEVWAYLTAGHVLEDFGRHELAIAFSRDGLLRARELGLGRQLAAPIAGNLAEALTAAGRWDEALEIIEELLSLDLPPLGRVHALLVRGRIAVLRGDADAAEAVTTRFPAPAPDPAGLRGSLARQAATLAQRNPRHQAYAALLSAEAARADGRLDLAAWDAAGTAWGNLGEPYMGAYCHL